MTDDEYMTISGDVAEGLGLARHYGWETHYKELVAAMPTNILLHVNSGNCSYGIWIDAWVEACQEELAERALLGNL